MRFAWVGVMAMVMAMAATAGCDAKKKSDGAGAGSVVPRKDLMTPQEKRRGEDACTAYVKQLCDCAAAKPDDAGLKERCELKRAKPEALDLAMGVVDDPNSSEDSLLRATVESRKIIARCIEETVQLPALGCR